jgi:hypothetical protein
VGRPAITTVVATLALIAAGAEAVPARASGAGSCAADPAPQGAGGWRRVRARDVLARLLLALGSRDSGTFAGLVTALEKSDLVVYIDAVPTIGNGPRGRLRFLGAAGGLRYVHVSIDAGSTSWQAAMQRRHDLIAILGHELQHAAEVAGTQVRDLAGFVDLYQTIGSRVHTTAFDTPAARAAARRIRAELMSDAEACAESP